MQAVFLKILNMSLSAGVVIAAVLVMRALLRRAPKKWSYLLWAAAGFRLCCPVSLRSAFSLFSLRPVQPAAAPSSAVSDAASALEYIPRSVGTAPRPAAPVGVWHVTGAIDPALPAAAEAVSRDPTQLLLTVGTAVWCLGMAAMLVYAAVSYARLRRGVSDAVLLHDNVWETDRIRSPFILGFARPRIYLPAGLDAQTLRYVMEHEAYHLRRRDHLIKAFAFLLLAVHWFNPLVWLAFFLMGKDLEMSCDEKVLSGAENIRRDYSSTLLSFATNGRFPAPSPLAFGETGVKSRIKNALSWKRPKLWATLAAAVLCLAVMAACALNPAEKPAEPPEPESEQTSAAPEQAAPGEIPNPLLTALKNSIAVGTPATQFSFTVPEGDHGTWDIRITGTATDPSGRSVSVSYFDEIDSWTPGMKYTCDLAASAGELRELTMHVSLTGNDGTAYQSDVDLTTRFPKPLIRAVADRLFGTCDHPGASVTVTVTDRSTGRVDTYQWQDQQRPSADSTLGYLLTNGCQWERNPIPEDLDSRYRGPYVLRIENAGGDSITVYSGAPYLSVNGSEFRIAGSVGDGSAPYPLLLQNVAQSAYFADTANAVTAPGSVTDYGEAARLIAEAYLARLLDRPDWVSGHAQDGTVESTEVFDAYYGDDLPNFCFNMHLRLKIDEPNTLYWQAGAGLAEPDARGYYGWGAEVVVRKLADGDWHFYDAGTGGYSVYLPGYANGFDYMETCSASELLDLYFKTAGMTRDWRILLALNENHTAGEVKAAMAALTDAQRAELLAGMERFNEEYRSVDWDGWPPMFDLAAYR